MQAGTLAQQNVSNIYRPIRANFEKNIPAKLGQKQNVVKCSIA